MSAIPQKGYNVEEKIKTVIILEVKNKSWELLSHPGA